MSADHVFDYSNGLNFAVAFTGYDSDYEPFDDPTIGEVVFNHYKWGLNPDGKTYVGRFPIKHHTCTREELGLDYDSSKSRFLPIHPNFLSQIETYHKKFLCIDDEDLKIFGDFSTESA